MTDSRFVILVLDGLRPDLVTPERMPNLSAFRDTGAVLANSRAQYPTHTRVNKVSFATGSTPRIHGIHFNKIFDPRLFADRVIDLGEHDDVRGADGRGDLITAPTLGNALAEAGRRFTLIHCGMSGAPWLLNYRGDRHGHEHLALAGYPFSTKRIARMVEDRLGAMPPPGGVNFDRTRFALKAFAEIVYPELAPDVTLIWSEEPDKSFHIDGLRGPGSSEAIAHADRLVGEIVLWWRMVGARDGVNLLIVSDHGHVEIAGLVPLVELMAETGLPITTDPARPGALLLPFGSGGLYLRDQDPQVLLDVVAWMQRQPWCGNLFTDDEDGINGIVPGTLSKTLASLDHPRAPDLLFTTRRFDAQQPEHPLGHCMDTGNAAGSTHGGLHREELSNIVFAAGPAIREAYRSETIGGMIDLVPTMLDRLSVTAPPSMAGRPLGDLFADGQAPADANAPVETATATCGPFVQHMSFRRLQLRTVLEHGWRD